MISRGISMVSELKQIINGRESVFLCPPSLVVMATPLGRSLEEYYQGISRGTGDHLQSLVHIGQVYPSPTHVWACLLIQSSSSDAHLKTFLQVTEGETPFVELIAAEGDWAGTQAYPGYLQAVHEEYSRGNTIGMALISPKDVSSRQLCWIKF